MATALQQVSLQERNLGLKAGKPCTMGSKGAASPEGTSVSEVPGCPLVSILVKTVPPEQRCKHLRLQDVRHRRGPWRTVSRPT